MLKGNRTTDTYNLTRNLKKKLSQPNFELMKGITRKYKINCSYKAKHLDKKIIINNLNIFYNI